MMGALRTGNPIIDMMLAMLVPIVIKIILDPTSKEWFIEFFTSVVFWWSPYHYREIEHKMLETSWGGTFSTDKDLRNNILIKAIQLFLDQEMKLEYTKASVVLQSTKTSDSPWPWHRDEDDEENTPAGKLKRFKVSKKPPKNTWSPVTKPGSAKPVELRVVENEKDKGEKAEKTTHVSTYVFRSRHKNEIDEFIGGCYTWYIEQLRKMEDDSRYLYEMQVNNNIHRGKGLDTRDDSGGRVFKRYKLSDDKTFESLFFDEKEKLLAQVVCVCVRVCVCVCVCARARVEATISPSTLHILCTGKALPGKDRQVRSEGLPSQARASSPRPTRHRQDIADQGPCATHGPINRQRAASAHLYQPGVNGYYVRSGDVECMPHQKRASHY